MSDNRVYSYSAVLMGSPILLKLYVHDEPLASRVFQLIKGYEDRSAAAATTNLYWPHLPEYCGGPATGGSPAYS